MIKHITLLFSILFIAKAGFSNVQNDIEKITFGPEFTLATSEGLPLDDNQKTRLRSAYFNALNKHLIDGQADGAKFKFNTPDKYTSPNGWHFEVEKDTGVLEINMSPLTVSESEKFAVDINDAIFVTAAKNNLVPSLFMGGGHLNIGLEQLLKHPMLLRNFLMDMLNNDFLFQGIFGYNLQAALPTSFFNEETHEDILQAFKDFDDEQEMDSEFLLNRLRTAFYRSKDNYPNNGNRNKYSALALNHTARANGTARIELRAFRPQSDYHQWVRQIRLIKNRLLYLSQFDKPIEFNPIFPYLKDGEHNEDIEQTLLNPTYKAEDVLKAFYNYLEDTGEAWKDHRDYIWPKWKMNYETGESELENFESSAWFQQREAQTGNLMEVQRKVLKPSCSNYLNEAW